MCYRSSAHEGSSSSVTRVVVPIIVSIFIALAAVVSFYSLSRALGTACGVIRYPHVPSY